MVNSNNLSLGIPPSSLFGQSIVDVFVLQGILDLEDAEELKKHFRTNREIENFLIKNRLVTKETINKAYSIVLKLPFVELKNVKISNEALELVPEKIARKYGIIPFDFSDKTLKIAVTNPSDLPLGFSVALGKLFKNKKICLELFVTVPEDLKKALEQYKNRPKKSLLIKKGSLPVVYLRNRQIDRAYLNKIPKDFIEKYRLLVFDENIHGNLLVACEKPDSPVTKKILDYIKKKNKIAVEVFATSQEDIDFVLGSYDQNSTFSVEPLKKDNPEAKKTVKEKVKLDLSSPLEEEKETETSIFSSLSDLFFGSDDGPSLTVDSIVPVKKIKKPDFINPIKKHIIVNESKKEKKPAINLIGKVDPIYLTKLPKEFIKKYHIVVFGENNKGELMLATDQPEADLTKKAIEFIGNQHPVELFSTSENDIEYAIQKWTTN